MPSGPIIGIATFFGLLSVITSTSTLCLLVCVVRLLKKNKSDKGTLCAYIHYIIMYFKGRLCLMICFDLFTESNDFHLPDDVPMTTNPSYMETILSTSQPPP